MFSGIFTSPLLSASRPSCQSWLTKTTHKNQLRHKRKRQARAALSKARLREGAASWQISPAYGPDSGPARPVLSDSLCLMQRDNQRKLSNCSCLGWWVRIGVNHRLTRKFKRKSQGGNFPGVKGGEGGENSYILENLESHVLVQLTHILRTSAVMTVKTTSFNP